MKRKLIIFGCGGHARSVLDILLDNQENYEIVFVDQNAKEDEHILQFPVLTNYEFDGNEMIFAAVGDNQLRKEILDRFTNDKIISIISKRAYIGYDAVIEKGVLIGADAHLGPGTKIGKGTILNTGAIVEHETAVGQYTHIAPGSVVCGRCQIGELVTIGAGSTVVDKITICDCVTIGAGGVVIKNIGNSGIYVGVPVKQVK